jgi:hypothetical protein
MGEFMIKKIKVILMLAGLVVATWGCTGSGEKIVKNFTDEEYFTAAKSYITYNQTFGAATNLSHSNFKVIEFNSLPTNSDGNDFQANHPYGKGKYTELVTLRKDFISNTDNTLIMIKRIAPSRRDNTTMTLSMKSGNNTTRFWDTNTSGFSWSHIPLRNKSYERFECDRIIMNAAGQAACLKAGTTSISLVRLSEKYGHRVSTTCRFDSNETVCNMRTALVSPKTYNKNTGVVTETALHPITP